MKTNIHFIFKRYIPVILTALLFMGCERDLEELKPATFPANPEVFIDGFSAGLNYAAFGGAVPTAFDVDNSVTWNNSKSSMRFDVPNAGDPQGAYAGGVFYTAVGRDLTGFNALTFWAKANQASVLDLVGFGNDLGISKYQVTVSGLKLSTVWKKYIIPLPDPSKLTAERGMFFYSVGPADGKGFSFWIDELKFEKLGTIAHPQYTILNGQNQSETTFTGVTKVIQGLTYTVNLPEGVNQVTGIAPAYFDFVTSNQNVATVDAMGKVTTVGGPGDAVISAKVGGKTAVGTLLVKSMGAFKPAPVPTRSADKVISVFSNAYTNVPVNYYNGYWEPWQTTLSADFEVSGDQILNYTNFNFVGIEFSSPTINATAMTHLHMDIFIPGKLTSNAQMRFEIVNSQPRVTGTVNRNITTAQTEQWISFDIPLSNFSGLTNRTTLMQLIFVDVNENIEGFYTDNIYFYNDAAPSAPLTAAPTPGHSASNVISVFSDTYTTIPGTDLNPNWGQSTATSVIQIQGNNTLKMAGLNYQGIQFGSSQNVSSMGFLHLDYWTSNSTELKVYLISPGPVETPFTLTVPTSGWRSVDIPLSSFAPVNLNDVFQLKFDGNGDIYFDNIYFRRN